jgi:hypothetical protein
VVENEWGSEHVTEISTLKRLFLKVKESGSTRGRVLVKKKTRKGWVTPVQ